MKNQKNLDLIYKVFSSLFGDIELHTVPKQFAIECIKKYPKSVDICLGCNKAVWTGLIFCPYCDSYHFEPISEDVANNLNLESEEINYFILEK